MKHFFTHYNLSFWNQIGQTWKQWFNVYPDVMDLVQRWLIVASPMKREINLSLFKRQTQLLKKRALFI